uniref:Uncharacterized protein n=1 Tax=Nelumbo nucifera TaxID=4432 RepID=A0A822Y0C9_NELNU|nr:TPA_asm: hypothetical protein HUJ06_026170 [Nelumbo nucifera]
MLTMAEERTKGSIAVALFSIVLLVFPLGFSNAYKVYKRVIEMPNGCRIDDCVNSCERIYGQRTIATACGCITGFHKCMCIGEGAF